MVAAVQPSGTNRHKEVCRRRSWEMGPLENPKPLSSVVLGLQALGHEALRTVSLACNSQSLAAAWGSRLLGSSKVNAVYGDRRTMMLEPIYHSIPSPGMERESLLTPSRHLNTNRPFQTGFGDHTQILLSAVRSLQESQSITLLQNKQKPKIKSRNSPSEKACVKTWV